MYGICRFPVTVSDAVENKKISNIILMHMGGKEL